MAWWAGELVTIDRAWRERGTATVPPKRSAPRATPYIPSSLERTSTPRRGTFARSPPPGNWGCSTGPRGSHAPQRPSSSAEASAQVRAARGVFAWARSEGIATEQAGIGEPGALVGESKPSLVVGRGPQQTQAEVPEAARVEQVLAGEGEGGAGHAVGAAGDVVRAEADLLSEAPDA